MDSFVEDIMERDGIKIHFWTGGKAGTPWLVFTHGATIDHHEWDQTIDLSENSYRVLVWDVRGHGRSRPGKFGMRQTVEDLISILDYLKIEQAIFVGHSLGGNIHQEIVFLHPERVRAMIFVGCTWNFQKLSKWESIQLNSAKWIFKLYAYQELVDQSLKLTAKSFESQRILREAVEKLSKDEIVQIMMEAVLCLHYEPGYVISKPLLLLVGDRDRTGNIRKIMPVWAKQEPDCRFFVVPDSLHAPNLDNPDFFHEKLFAFLDHVKDSSQ